MLDGDILDTCMHSHVKHIRGSGRAAHGMTSPLPRGLSCIGDNNPTPHVICGFLLSASLYTPSTTLFNVAPLPPCAVQSKQPPCTTQKPEDADRALQDIKNYATSRKHTGSHVMSRCMCFSMNRIAVEKICQSAKHIRWQLRHKKRADQGCKQ